MRRYDGIATLMLIDCAPDDGYLRVGLAFAPASTPERPPEAPAAAPGSEPAEREPLQRLFAHLKPCG